MEAIDRVLEWNRAKWEGKNVEMYAEGGENTWAWYNDSLDPDVAEFLAARPGEFKTTLDLGTCSGAQAIGLAEQGYTVIGSEISQTALHKAELNLQTAPGPIQERVSFVMDDIVRSSFADDQFDLILDRGCYHSICCFSHQQYLAQVKRLLRPGGVLLLKTMSAKEDRFAAYDTVGAVKFPMPYKFDEAKLRQVFADGLTIVEIRDSFFYSVVLDPPAHAIFTILQNGK